MNNFEKAKEAFLTGLECIEKEQYENAIRSFKESLEIIPDRVSALINLSAVLLKIKKYEEALTFIERALVIDENAYEAWCNKGIANLGKKELSNAKKCFEKALNLNEEYIEALLGNAKVHLGYGDYENAEKLINKVIQLDSDLAIAYSDLAKLHMKKREWEFAIKNFNKAITKDSRDTDFYLGKALIYLETKEKETALKVVEEGISQNENKSDLWALKANIELEKKLYLSSINSYKKAYDLDANYPYLIGDFISIKLAICDWENLDELIKVAIKRSNEGHKAITPFSMLSISESTSEQLQSAKIWVNDFEPVSRKEIERNKRSHQKIKIGYFSMDFRIHPVSFLTVEMYELHDRKKFEVYAFSYGPNTQDEMRKRLEVAFDKFIDVENMSDLEIVEIARKLEIDIAVDLAGHTLNARKGLFSLGIAPCQVSYLGFPGTLGDPSIEYIIADENLIPIEEQKNYNEKIIYLPHCFQVNDRKRAVSKYKFSREEMGLPNDGTIYCSFCNTFKFNPQRFKTWMQILHGVENSCLWLLSENELIENNIKKEAQKYGINSNRIIFGGRLPMQDYLARYRVADLFLDTYPFNAGTTASDALWAGLPVLTLPGRAYASRMASSLLIAVGLQELIANSEAQYLAIAIEYGNDPNKIKLLKNKLASLLINCDLFDTPKIVRDIEKEFERLIKKNK